VVYLWPCHQQAWQVFLACQTQWRVGLQGATGLDYGAVRVVMDMAGVGRQQRAQVFGAVRVCEAQVLDEWQRTSQRQ
jgi:hypothetical protein